MDLQFIKVASNFVVWLVSFSVLIQNVNILHDCYARHLKPACHLFSFSLLSPLSLLLSSVILTCMQNHPLPPSLTNSLTHALTNMHTLTAQPLRVVTEDTCLFHYLVPAPMSPSNKSVGSDAGSQDSGDGNAGPRFVCV